MVVLLAVLALWVLAWRQEFAAVAPPQRSTVSPIPIERAVVDAPAKAGPSPAASGCRGTAVIFTARSLAGVARGWAQRCERAPSDRPERLAQSGAGGPVLARVAIGSNGPVRLASRHEAIFSRLAYSAS